MTNNETVADIVREMRGPYYKMGRSNASLDKQMMDYMSFIADRIESAHKREIAELRECLKEAIREKCPFTRMSCKHDEPCDYECGTEKWREALKGSNNATK